MKSGGRGNGKRGEGLKKLGYIASVIGLSLISYNCKKHNIVPTPVGGPVHVYVTDTETDSPLDNIPISVNCGGQIYEGKTSNGMYKFDVSGPVHCDVKVNFSNSVQERDKERLPSITKQVAFVGNDDFNIDIVREAYLNPDGYNWRELLNAYRGNLIGLNEVWTKRPDRFIVYDPHNVLKQYNDPKRNPVMDNIMKGFRAADEYSCGVVRAPSLDEIEIKYEKSHWSNGDMFFEITDGEAYEEEFVDNNEIKRSGAGGGPYALTQNFVSEIVSSIQGGDNEGDVPCIFGANVHLTEQDKNWGRFNYKQREPGSQVVVDGEFGHLYEVRLKR